MATPLERVRTAWTKGDRLALHHEVEQLAAEGHSRQSLESVLEALLHEVRSTGSDDETEEMINGVWDRLTGWCHPGRQIATVIDTKESVGIATPSIVGRSGTT